MLLASASLPTMKPEMFWMERKGSRRATHSWMNLVPFNADSEKRVLLLATILSWRQWILQSFGIVSHWLGTCFSVAKGESRAGVGGREQTSNEGSAIGLFEFIKVAAVNYHRNNLSDVDSFPKISPGDAIQLFPVIYRLQHHRCSTC